MLKDILMFDIENSDIKTLQKSIVPTFSKQQLMCSIAYKRELIMPPTPTALLFLQRGPENFSILTKRRGLALFEFLGGSGIFHGEAWGFSKNKSQQLMKYHIKNNVNYSNNRNHNVLYLLTTFKCLQVVN